MAFEYTGIEFEATPARPAPGPEFIPSQKVIEKLAELLPNIQKIKTPESTSS